MPVMFETNVFCVKSMDFMHERKLVVHEVPCDDNSVHVFVV